MENTTVTVSSASEQAVECKKSRFKWKMPAWCGNMPFVRALILLVVSAMLLGFAFLPIGIFSVDIEELVDGSDDAAAFAGMDISLDFNVIDLYIFMYDNTQDLVFDIESGKFPESDLWDEVYKMSGSVSTDNIVMLLLGDRDAFYDKMTDNMETQMYNTLRLALQDAEMSIVAELVAAVIIATLYILVCIAFFVFSLLNFISVVRGGRGFEKVATTLLCLIPGAVFAMFAIFFVVMNARAFGAGTWLTLVVALAAVVFLGLTNLAKRRAHSTRGIVTRACALVLTVLMVCVCFAPVMTMSVKAIFLMRTEETEATVDMDASMYGGLNVSAKEYETYRESAVAGYNQLSTITKLGFEQGEAKDIAETLGHFGLLCADKGTGTTYFSLTSIPLILMFVTAALIIWQVMSYFVTGHDCKRLSIILRAVALGLVVVFLALNIVIVCVSNAGSDATDFKGVTSAPQFGAKRMLGDYVSFGMGFASIAAAVVAIGLMVVPYGRYRKKNWDGENASTEESSATESSGNVETCVACGAHLRDGERFCMVCGTRVVSAETAPTAEPVPTEQAPSV